MKPIAVKAAKVLVLFPIGAIIGIFPIGLIIALARIERNIFVYLLPTLVFAWATLFTWWTLPRIVFFEEGFTWKDRADKLIRGSVYVLAVLLGMGLLILLGVTAERFKPAVTRILAPILANEYLTMQLGMFFLIVFLVLSAAIGGWVFESRGGPNKTRWNKGKGIIGIGVCIYSLCLLLFIVGLRFGWSESLLAGICLVQLIMTLFFLSAGFEVVFIGRVNYPLTYYYCPGCGGHIGFNVLPDDGEKDFCPHCGHGIHG